MHTPTNHVDARSCNFCHVCQNAASSSRQIYRVVAIDGRLKVV